MYLTVLCLAADFEGVLRHADVLYYLLQQKHGAMIGPTGHGSDASGSKTLIRV